MLIKNLGYTANRYENPKKSFTELEIHAIMTLMYKIHNLYCVFLNYVVHIDE